MTSLPQSEYEQRAADNDVKATLDAIRAIADAIRALGEVPSGHLYARVMAYMSIETYESIIGVLKRAGLVEEKSHLLTWKGPRA